MNEVSGGHVTVGNNTNAYIAGGGNTTNAPNDAGHQIVFYTRIDTHLLSSITSITSHGDLSSNVQGGAGATTNTTGIILMGSGHENKKQTFEYASNVVATSLGDLSAVYSSPGVNQAPATF